MTASTTARRATLLPPVHVRPSFFAAGALTVEKAVEFSGLSERRLWELMAEGKLTWGVHPRTRGRLIPVSSLAAYLDANVELTEGEF